MDRVVNVLTIDVEEHFHAHAFETVIPRATWDSLPSRVGPNTRRVLRVLEEYGVHGTFFLLGWVADRHPDLVREIAAAGHEVATHGYWHELIYRQSPEAFTADLRRSLDAIGRALDVLRDHGLVYDSSIFPLSAHDRYGIGDADRFANRLRNGLWEFPASTVRLGGRNWPVAGGGYLRLLPLSLTRRAIRRLNAEGHPAIVYLHPWELDPEQPRVADAPLLSRFRHYVNIGRTEERLRALLSEARFGPIREVFAHLLAAPAAEVGSTPAARRAVEAGSSRRA
jgi:peptidoglycan/xylan/chitin deacetylase (PgdA/CDA1 family)